MNIEIIYNTLFRRYTVLEFDDGRIIDEMEYKTIEEIRDCYGELPENVTVCGLPGMNHVAYIPTKRFYHPLPA